MSETKLSALSDLDLHKSNIKTAAEDRAITLKLLRHLIETDRRRMYSNFRCSSLHAYCVKELKMSDQEAGRRVSAARLLREAPVVEEKILDGSLSLTSVSQASVFFAKEARNGNRVDLQEKIKVLEDLETKSTRDVQSILLSKSDQPEIHLKESVKPKTPSLSEFRTHFDQETIDLLNRAKEIWSHSMPHASYADLLKRSLKETVERHDPLKKAERAETRGKRMAANQEAKVESRAAKPNERKAGYANSPAFIRHQVRLRDQGACTFVDPRTGEICGSKHFIEEDHIVPKAMGGEYSIENLRLRCRAHNQRHAINTYGFEKMRPHFEKQP